MANAIDDAKHSLDAHAQAIDALHHKLAASPGVNKEKLQHAVTKYKAAHQAFHDDALECMH
ncbi:MAG: hypothetical protein M3N19_09770 [Candidatus Eremiobacteraeota bacterium]|nr:hypothetical protein [Candidatus Eremiobacteraeota bacterium]